MTALTHAQALICGATSTVTYAISTPSGTSAVQVRGDVVVEAAAPFAYLRGSTVVEVAAWVKKYGYTFGDGIRLGPAMLNCWRGIRWFEATS